MRKFKKALITGVCGSGGSYLAEYIINMKRIRKYNDFLEFQKMTFAPHFLVRFLIRFSSFDTIFDMVFLLNLPS